MILSMCEDLWKMIAVSMCGSEGSRDSKVTK